ncbi:ATP-binding cassette domain-containing protein [Herbaspirillum sp. WKF16]|uniref:ABC transporter ATP-binding protein n=1 Tax=Herbaspirillum sp. WKF16 TaxID=3028312 RepID=UPI0023A9FA5B|nr:ATP-binding cassette domain-containing protein [Herbaspirillum sp. WKF16]WDZ96752.1 ATP-binding cassette domain-containing protein [Herbaspirillum sp. WKF16]
MMEKSVSPALAVEKLRVLHGAQELVRGISFSIPVGGVLTLLGESGSGKSLLAQAIMGNLPSTLRCEGEVSIGGERSDAADQASRHAGWGRRLSLLPQEPWLALDPTMKVRRQIEETYELVSHPALSSQNDSLHAAKVGARERAMRALAGLGLQDAAAKYPFMISGGMAQRVAFLATHAAGAPVMIIDEPTKGLDIARRDEVLALLKNALSEGMSLLCITHDVWLARALGGQLSVMLDGAMIEHGEAQQVLDAPSHDYTRRLLQAEPGNWPRQLGGSSTSAKIVATMTNVAKSFGRQKLFSGMSAEIRAGEIIAVSGPSGSGKTTFGNVVLGLAKPDQGQVTRTAGLPATAFQKIYQDPAAAFAPGASLRRSLQDLVTLHRLDWSALEALLSRMRLTPALLDRKPGQVSGGELQRIALARVLLMKPALIFADEPTSRLDPVTQQDVIALLMEKTRASGCAVLLVTHDADIANKVADRKLQLVS